MHKSNLMIHNLRNITRLCQAFRLQLSASIPLVVFRSELEASTKEEMVGDCGRARADQ